MWQRERNNLFPDVRDQYDSIATSDNLHLRRASVSLARSTQLRSGLALSEDSLPY